MPEPPVVAALVPDLFFAVPIADAVRAAGAVPDILEDPADLWPAIDDSWPSLVLIDLAVSGDWQTAVRRAKSLPHTRTIPIVAFGSHVETSTLQSARAAGCDHAWARSRFVKELPDLLKRVLCPETRFVDGWSDPPPARLCLGLEEFNRGEYWECHETLEALWGSEPRPVRDLYQGILQIGVAFHHLRSGNYPGTVKMLRRGIPRLRGLPEVTQGVPVSALQTAACDVYDRVAALGPERLDQFDCSTLPKIVLVAACA